jgi:hypothetical protein
MSDYYTPTSGISSGASALDLSGDLMEENPLGSLNDPGDDWTINSQQNERSTADTVMGSRSESSHSLGLTATGFTQLTAPSQCNWTDQTQHASQEYSGRPTPGMLLLDLDFELLTATASTQSSSQETLQTLVSEHPFSGQSVSVTGATQIPEEESHRPSWFSTGLYTPVEDPPPPPGSPSSPCPLPSEPVSFQPRRNPDRPGRPPRGNLDDLNLLRDTVYYGKLPDSYKRNPVAEKQIRRKADDIRCTWIGPSIFCNNGGDGFFFEILGPYAARPGTLIAIYYGPDTSRPHNAKIKAFLKTWLGCDNILVHERAGYAVKGDVKCGPAYTNDGFDKVNVYFSYSKELKRMELRTTGPLLPGNYEALVNYDTPGQPSTYWTPFRRELLPPDTLIRLEDTYPAHSQTRDKQRRKKTPNIQGRTTPK